MRPPQEMHDRMERLLGSPPVDGRRATGGYSIAEHWTLEIADGRRVFAKVATTERLGGCHRLDLRRMFRAVRCTGWTSAAPTAI